ncbi:MAG: hypothetical protein K6F09_07620 [Clostridiales bacterium]|nr:hypothetical protein [Clostridiales bacterium]
MKTVYICIDDTDNIDSIGTGEILENICDRLKDEGIAEGGFVTRHQLLISDKIAYTSHNSSMCSALLTDDTEAVVRFAGEYLENNSADGSDPGLCVYEPKGSDTSFLTAFGKRAQSEVLTKDDAFNTAKLYDGEIFLSEHGGDGSGIIGALAGIGLRLTGSDGRIKGKIFPEKEGERLTCRDFCKKYGAGQAIDSETLKKIPDDETICFEAVTKAVYRDFMITIVAERRGDLYVPVPKKLKNKK